METTDALELIQSAIEVAPAGKARFRLQGGVIQVSVDGSAWAAIGAGAATVTTAAPVSGDGSGGSPVTVAAGAVALAKLANAAGAGFVGAAGAGAWAEKTGTQATALLDQATTLLPGLQPVAARLVMPGRGTDLADADATIQPFSVGKSLFVIPAATLTANRTITLGNTSAPGAGVAWLLDIVRLDTTANQIVWKKADATTIYTDPGTPAAARHFQFICVNGVWSSNTGQLIG